MAELGVAGSAVGVVSLGIQVCQGLLTYYQGWRSYHEDIQSAYNKIADLADTFEQLNGVLHDDSLSQLHATRVNQCLVNCSDDIKKLEKRLNKLRSNDDPRGFRQVLSAGHLRLLYPFKKDTLENISLTVDNTVQRLNLALDVLHVKTSATTLGEVRGVRTDLDLLKNGNARIEQALDVLHLRTAPAIHVETQTVPTDLAHLKVSVTRVEKGLQDIRDLLLPSIPQHINPPGTSQMDAVKAMKMWLGAPDPHTYHNTVRKPYKPGSGQWLLDSADYKRWNAGELKTLSLVGQPGGGKSVLCSIIIDRVAQHAKDNNQLFAFFYFSLADTRRQNYRDMLLSLIDQLCAYEPVFAILHEYSKYSSGAVSTEILEQCLKTLSHLPRQTRIILDGLDEGLLYNDARTKMTAGLMKMSNLLEGTNLSILMTSRYDIDIMYAMKKFNGCVVELNPENMNNDIESYVRSRLQRHRVLRGWPLETKSKIVKDICSTAEGRFILVNCQFAELSRLKVITPDSVAKALESLPICLPESYERILTRIAPQDRHIAMTALE